MTSVFCNIGEILKKSMYQISTEVLYESGRLTVLRHSNFDSLILELSQSLSILIT